MQTTEQLQRSINSADDLSDIVKTMKSMAAVSINRYERAVESINEYYRTVLLGLQAVIQTGQVEMLRQNKQNRVKRYGIVVFGSDQGMCGSFNDKIVDYTIGKITELTDDSSSVRIICVGARAAALLEAEGRTPEFVYRVPGSLGAVVPQSQNILADINSWQEEELVNSVKLFHNSKAKGGVSYTQENIHLLPLADDWYTDMITRSWPSRSIPVYTMDRNRLFSSLVRQYFFVTLYRAFVQSMATENADRLSSMQAAEKNIEERLEDLTSLQRRKRQTSITSELIDIVSGFEALADEVS